MPTTPTLACQRRDRQRHLQTRILRTVPLQGPTRKTIFIQANGSPERDYRGKHRSCTPVVGTAGAHGRASKEMVLPVGCVLDSSIRLAVTANSSSVIDSDLHLRPGPAVHRYSNINKDGCTGVSVFTLRICLSACPQSLTHAIAPAPNVLSGVSWQVTWLQLTATRQQSSNTFPSQPFDVVRFGDESISALVSICGP